MSDSFNSVVTGDPDDLKACFSSGSSTGLSFSTILMNTCFPTLYRHLNSLSVRASMRSRVKFMRIRCLLARRPMTLTRTRLGTFKMTGLARR